MGQVNAIAITLGLSSILCFYSRFQICNQLDSSQHKQGMFRIPSASAVRLVALGYDRLVADFYWLAFINYVGDTQQRVADHSFEADRYIDLITELDPTFVQPYWYCAFTVGADANRPYRAHQLIVRGMNANPSNWYLPYIAGLNLFLFAHDGKAAAQYFGLASRLDGSPAWLERQAHILSANIPAIIKKINAWTVVYNADPSKLIRAHAREQLVLLWSKVYYSSPQGAGREAARRALEELK